MAKALDDMALEELWQLFPIMLTEHQASWAAWFDEERGFLSAILSPLMDCEISHIGSTAIEGIWAKPIVDILVEVPSAADLTPAKAALVSNGYICMQGRDFNKGYTPEGFAERVFHVHVRVRGDDDEVYFRDYLNGHPAVAEEYEKLKLELWKRFEHDRDAYTQAKAAFVEKYTNIAKGLG